MIGMLDISREIISGRVSPTVSECILLSFHRSASCGNSEFALTAIGLD